MNQYHIDINTVIIQADSEEEAEREYLSLIEDPETAIGILKEYVVTE